jgi:GH25 family lysozyme M1 (1,4-beta-N-acetylmuramidase)
VNCIDISSWQEGLDLGNLFAQNKALGGVIVKLTEGITYVNPEADRWISWLKEAGKPFGTYHYLTGGHAQREAQHYAEVLKDYPGGVPALDYEGTALTEGPGYLKACLDEVTRLTGTKPLVYTSLSVVQTQDFRDIAEAGYRLWLAQYADMREVHGFLEAPWQNGSTAPFESCVMHQYTSCGRLNGYNRNLDFDLFRGTEEDWKRLATSGEATEADGGEPNGPDPAVVNDVVTGKYGNGPDRAARLAAAGYDYETVQRLVNELYAVGLSCKRYITGYEDYLNSLCYIIRSL